MNILVTGGGGQLALCIQKEAAKRKVPHRFFYPDKAALDLTDEEAVTRFVEEHAIAVIINTAAYTAVDLAEEHQEKAFAINHKAVEHLGRVCKKYAIRLIHISTDYVFDGQGCRPYTTRVQPRPINTYGASKRAGEQALEALKLSNTAIVRTSWLYSEFNTNFFKTMLRLGETKSRINVVDDQIGSPTYAGDLAGFILKYLLTLKTNEVKVFQYSNEGVASWYDFAVAIMQLSKSKTAVDPVPSTQFPTRAKRPAYAVLDKTELKAFFDCKIPYWKTSLETCYQQFSTSSL